VGQFLDNCPSVIHDPAHFSPVGMTVTEGALYMRHHQALMVGIPLLILAPLYTPAEAQKNWADVQSGDVIDFLLPAPEQAALAEAVFITGGRLLTIDTTGCTPFTGQHPVQHYTLVDPTGTRSPRSGGLVPLTIDPVHPGTRLGQLTFTHTCLIGGVLYHYYQGTVQ
jgi:hypothetical protein